MSVPEDEERLLPLAQRWPRASKFLLSGCAATVAELATFPLDLTKTRLQMQGEAALARLGDSARESAPYRGMVRTALGIVQEEGFLKLWQGVTPAIYRHIVYSGGRMVTYEHLREVVFGKTEDKHYPLWKSVIGGMMAGVVGQFLANPTDLVKVQMQMEGKRKLEGKPLRFRGVHHAFAKILAEGGVRGLWAGWVPNIQRAALVNMGVSEYDITIFSVEQPRNQGMILFSFQSLTLYSQSVTKSSQFYLPDISQICLLVFIPGATPLSKYYLPPPTGPLQNPPNWSPHVYPTAVLFHDASETVLIKVTSAYHFI
ncbi:mitochondrial uncoupling protein 4 isoform X4 [Diceros bicornis minor]|uniref:mitochondrial uncoupling protein 4 isoform X4 n=1 Tax=Diceros bicornis minor TaxID=77932 RepID=UPI0026EABB47|nr:mitochondrial uncoupling protein 4 isoform X4 [Diceros bicornis minor]